MARVSRKGHNVPQTVQTELWNVALYIRLSVENNGQTGEGSIENQRELLEHFVKKMENVVSVSTYIDNGETGTDFARPKWRQMIQDVKDNKINCIVVKDLSRFARNYIEAGDYLEKIFPFLAVRFIAVNDCYDSRGLLFLENELTVSLKNLINDYYAKDISRKVMSSFHAKKQNGEFIGSQAPYGYLLKDNRFRVDQEAASVVKKIFELFLQGKSGYAIAKQLNEEQIPSPSKYACERGLKKYQNCKNVLWQQQAVTRILYNQTYTGSLVQEKHNKSIYARERIGLRSEDKWLVMPNMNEAIIERDVFEKVQIVRKRNQAIKKKRCESSKENVKENILKGYVFCGICGHPLRRNSTARRGKAEYAYFCATKYNHADAECTTAMIVERKVLDAIFKNIRVQIELAVEIDSLMKQIKSAASKSDIYQELCQQLKQSETELNRITALKNSIYEDYKTNILTRDEYLLAKHRYTRQIEELSKIVEKAELKRKLYEENLTNKNKWVRQFRKFEEGKQLSREMVVELLDRVEVFPDRRIQVTFRFSDEYQSVIRYIGDSMGKWEEGQGGAEVLSRIS